jgi:hypothetical protein
MHYRSYCLLHVIGEEGTTAAYSEIIPELLESDVKRMLG